MKQVFKMVTVCGVSLCLTAGSVLGSSHLLPSNIAYANVQVQSTGSDSFILQENSNDIIFNGNTVSSDEPLAVTKGVSYIQFKTIANLYGFKISYDSKTKESIATSNTTTISFKANSDVVKVNGKNIKAAGTVYTNNGYLMIPVRTWANITNSSVSSKNGTVTLNWNTTPKAIFSIGETRIVAGETKVTYTDHATSPANYQIVAEEWTGKQEIFDTPGVYTISRRVQDSRGVWSAPYSLNITVLKPNEPPVANFTTNKTTYKLGEPVIYTNTSTDDGIIVRNTWTGNDPAYFEPGTHTIKLEVQDEFGLTSNVTKQIEVVDEVMYTKEQFYLNFTQPGGKMPISSSQALGIAAVPYKITPDNMTIVRTNSPELLIGQYIDYSDTISGKVRFNIHKKNGLKDPLMLHLIVTNETDEVGYIQTDKYSHAGPATYVSTSGKTAVTRFLNQTIDNESGKAIALQPGESIELFPKGSLSPIKHTQTMSIFAEYKSSIPLRYTLVVTDPDKDAIESMDTLIQSELDMKHVRATFKGGNRTITTDKVLGQNGPDKLVFGDTVNDTILEGIDAITGSPVTNFGNGGVFYKIDLDVAPETAIVLNPRGGHYAGAFIVNNKVVQLTSNSILQGPSEAGFLHRTGKTQEKVELAFIVAPGSNLPINLLFLPLPDLKSPVKEQAAQIEKTEQPAESIDQQ